jgi:Tfp pilus assembly protein FimT
MQPLAVFKLRRSPSGVTLVETLAIVAVIGILAGIAAPSFLTWLSNKKIEDVTAQTESAIREAQSEAIKKSISCTLTIDKANAKISSDPTTCLPTGERDLSKLGVRALSNNTTEVAIGTANLGSTDSFEFSQKGTLSVVGGVGMIVLYHSGDATNQRNRNRCIAVASGIGLIRTGIYIGSNPSNPSDTNNCNTSS